MVTYVIEASHLFRAGDIHRTQLFVADVVTFLNRKFFDDAEYQIIVLHGSVKDEQVERYAAALERHKIRVIRMRPIVSTVEGKHYYKPTWYLYKLLGSDIPRGSQLVLIGFHNARYKAFISKFHQEYRISVCAFSTPSKKTGVMRIPEDFTPLLEHAISLDEYVTDIKAEFKRKKQISVL